MLGPRSLMLMLQLPDPGSRAFLVLLVSRGAADTECTFHFALPNYRQTSSFMEYGRPRRPHRSDWRTIRDTLQMLFAGATR